MEKHNESFQADVQQDIIRQLTSLLFCGISITQTAEQDQFTFIVDQNDRRFHYSAYSVGCASVRPVTEVTSAFRALGKSAVKKSCRLWLKALYSESIMLVH